MGEPGQELPSRRVISKTASRLRRRPKPPHLPRTGRVLSVRGLAIEAAVALPILDGVSFDLMPGEILGVVGSLVPVSPPCSRHRRLLATVCSGGGHVFFPQGLPNSMKKTLRSIRGYEILPLLPNAKSQLIRLVRVGDLMVAHIRAHNRCSRRGTARAARMLGAIGIGDANHWLAAYPHELSGGMAQRVCLPSPWCIGRH